MTDKKTSELTRRGFIKVGAGAMAAASMPMFFTKDAWAANEFRNNPGNAGSVKFGFNVPQTGAYADEGADELGPTNWL